MTIPERTQDAIQDPQERREGDEPEARLAELARFYQAAGAGAWHRHGGAWAADPQAVARRRAWKEKIRRKAGLEPDTAGPTT
jgi:hypothetical protein